MSGEYATAGTAVAAGEMETVPALKRVGCTGALTYLAVDATDGAAGQEMARARIFIALTGLVFVAFGLWGFFAPAAMMENFQVTLAAPSARTAMRAIYGGTLTGIGALYVYLAASADRTRNGLWAIVIVTGAVLSARLLGMAVDGATSTFHLAYAGLEVVGIVLAIIFLRSMPSAAGGQSK